MKNKADLWDWLYNTYTHTYRRATRSNTNFWNYFLLLLVDFVFVFFILNSFLFIQTHIIHLYKSHFGLSKLFAYKLSSLYRKGEFWCRMKLIRQKQKGRKKIRSLNTWNLGRGIFIIEFCFSMIKWWRASGGGVLKRGRGRELNHFNFDWCCSSVALLVKMFGYFALDTFRDRVLDAILLLAGK